MNLENFDDIVFLGSFSRLTDKGVTMLEELLIKDEGKHSRIQREYTIASKRLFKR